MATMKLYLDDIDVDLAILPRNSDHADTLADYTRQYQVEGESALPPIDVFRDSKAGKNWLANGLYRLKAAKAAGLDKIPCQIQSGTKTDALLFASGANRKHGLPLTMAERKRAAENILKDIGLSKLKGDGEIGGIVGLSGSAVQKIRWRMEREKKRPRQTTKHGSLRVIGGVIGVIGGSLGSHLRY